MTYDEVLAIQHEVLIGETEIYNAYLRLQQTKERLVKAEAAYLTAKGVPITAHIKNGNHGWTAGESVAHKSSMPRMVFVPDDK